MFISVVKYLLIVIICVVILVNFGDIMIILLQIVVRFKISQFFRRQSEIITKRAFSDFISSWRSFCERTGRNKRKC